MIALLRRKPTQTITRHFDSLPIYELLFWGGLLTTLSATSHGDFPHNVPLGACSLSARVDLEPQSKRILCLVNDSACCNFGHLGPTATLTRS